MPEIPDKIAIHPLIKFRLMIRPNLEDMGRLDPLAFKAASVFGPCFGVGATLVLYWLTCDLLGLQTSTSAYLVVGGILSLPILIFLCPLVFKLSIRNCPPGSAAMLLNVVTAGQIINLLSFPVIFLAVLSFGADAKHARDLTLNYLVLGALLGLLTALAFILVYRKHDTSTMPKGDNP